MTFVQPIPQPLDYHHFVDGRTLLGVPNFWNVVTNAGFVFATIGTAAGLVALAIGRLDDPGLAAVLAGLAVAYAIAGTLWCAMLAIRALTTPGLMDLGATGREASEAERLLGMAMGGLFAAYILGTSVVLVEQDIAQAMKVSQRVYCFQEGRLSLAGNPAGLSREAIHVAYFGS